MKRYSAALSGFAFVWIAAMLPSAARDFVQDQAGMFSASTVASLNERIGNFNAQTGKEIVVVTVPSLGSTALQSAAQSAFSEQQVNGVLIFVARDDRRDIIVPDRVGVQAGWFTPDILSSIRTSMEAQFRTENYDAGISGAVDSILGIYRSHAGSLQRSGSSALAVPSQRTSSNGMQISTFWWIIIGVVGFLLIRSILRAMATPRNYGPAPAGAPPTALPPAGPGNAPGPGYGPGYGYGGGGSFWSGLLGGLGGAWLGNEMFRGGGGGSIAPAQAATPDAGSWGGDSGAGWQSDAGQAGSGASSGDWSGGGFGGGDFGGGGDSGGGDSGGGW